MVTDIRTMKEISDFVAGFSGDAVFSDPMARTAEQLAEQRVYFFLVVVG